VGWVPYLLDTTRPHIAMPDKGREKCNFLSIWMLAAWATLPSMKKLPLQTYTTATPK